MSEIIKVGDIKVGSGGSGEPLSCRSCEALQAKLDEAEKEVERLKEDLEKKYSLNSHEVVRDMLYMEIKELKSHLAICKEFIEKNVDHNYFETSNPQLASHREWECKKCVLLSRLQSETTMGNGEKG